MKLHNIKIVMVGTTHPGNIGAAARAMNNMCFSHLSLVDPQCPIGETAYARASGANGILDKRETCSDLSQAIEDCSLVVAASARRRSLPWPELSPAELAVKLDSMADSNHAALVFGREHSGLTNEEIQVCNQMVCIPANPEFSSLNLASAIQILCYEIYARLGNTMPPAKAPDAHDLPAPNAEVEGYIQHLEKTLKGCGYLDPGQPGMIMQRLRRLYLRSELTRNEINILRGMLTAIEKQQI
ncbi:MAG: RNA methyltransferase [Gammaproteobacteria bacterium]|nr:RNA methyltransferase [Gammaproteobacteria bacterium]MDH3856803.1 RNA methyltransferase [Gammaproteobacteria bacterium]